MGSIMIYWMYLTVFCHTLTSAFTYPSSLCITMGTTKCISNDSSASRKQSLLFMKENYDHDSEDDDDDEEVMKPYGRRSLNWTRRYNKLISYEKARLSVLALGLQSKAEWDQYVADGKEFHGAYLPNRPDEMYADEWISWEEFLGAMRTYDQTRDMVQNVLKIRGRLEYELFVSRDPKRAEGLRIPKLPWKVYHGKGWKNDEHFFGQ